MVQIKKRRQKRSGMLVLSVTGNRASTHRGPEGTTTSTGPGQVTAHLGLTYQTASFSSAHYVIRGSSFQNPAKGLIDQCEQSPIFLSGDLTYMGYR